MGYVLPVEVDPAGVRSDQPHYRIEAGGFACAVGTEQPDHFAALNVKRNVVQYRALVVAFGDRAHFQPAHRRGCGVGRGFEERGFVHGLVLRLGTVKRPLTRPPLWFTPRTPPSITARPVSRSMVRRAPLRKEPSRSS